MEEQRLNYSTIFCPPPYGLKSYTFDSNNEFLSTYVKLSHGFR